MKLHMLDPVAARCVNLSVYSFGLPFSTQVLWAAGTTRGVSSKADVLTMASVAFWTSYKLPCGRMRFWGSVSFVCRGVLNILKPTHSTGKAASLASS